MDLFAKKPTVKEQVRISQREIGKGVRDLERELLVLKREEAKLIKDIKSTAKTGNQAGTRHLAKSLVRLRAQMTKMHSSIAQLQGVKTGVATAAATAKVGQTMASAGQAMAAIGAAADPQKMAASMQKYAMESAKMDMTSEMMNDAIDGAMDADEVDEETDDVMNQVLDEIGVDVSSQMSAAPKGRVPVAGQKVAQQAEEEDTAESDLMQRLAALR